MPRWFLWSCVHRKRYHCWGTMFVSPDAEITWLVWGPTNPYHPGFWFCPFYFKDPLMSVFQRVWNCQPVSIYRNMLCQGSTWSYLQQWSHAMAVKLQRPRLVLGTEAGKDGPLVILSHSSLIVFLYVSMRKSFPNGHVWVHFFPTRVEQMLCFRSPKLGKPMIPYGFVIKWGAEEFAGSSFSHFPWL